MDDETGGVVRHHISVAPTGVGCSESQLEPGIAELALLSGSAESAPFVELDNLGPVCRVSTIAFIPTRRRGDQVLDGRRPTPPPVGHRSRHAHDLCGGTVRGITVPVPTTSAIATSVRPPV